MRVCEGVLGHVVSEEIEAATCSLYTAGGGGLDGRARLSCDQMRFHVCCVMPRENTCALRISEEILVCVCIFLLKNEMTFFS